ncbi:MAG: tripartite tricarboxylate transporter permease [Candidatus Altiarchaeota archaeon]
MLEYLVYALAGCAVGVVTGLTPGLHVNTVCLIGLGLYSRFGLDVVGFGVFMVGVSVTHTFLDFIPGIFLGVPDEGTALSILPAHRLVLAGRGLDAVKLTCYGCLIGLVFGLTLLVPMIIIVPMFYRQLREFVVYVIGAASLILILRERGGGKMWAAVIFLLSGCVGVLTLGIEGMSATYVLFPVFSGLFGVSGLVYSLMVSEANIPQERYSTTKVDAEIVGGGLLGAVGGAVVGLLPAMSPSQVGILMSGVFGASQRGFLVSVAAIQASDSLYSLAALYIIGNGRSGMSVMLGRMLELDADTLTLFVGVFCLVAFFAAHLHMEIGRRASVFYGMVDHRLMSAGVIMFVLALVYAFTGLFGILVALVCTAVGLLPILSGVSRTHLMGVLLVPTISYYLGLG